MRGDTLLGGLRRSFASVPALAPRVPFRFRRL
jgi:hypothetical protein